jgi:hypothetical protein
MTDKPASPFTGLDKALLRSTRKPSPSVAAENNQRGNKEEKSAPPPLLKQEVFSPSTTPTARPPDEAAKRPEDRTIGRGVLVRRGFEWREDQLRALKKLSLKEQLEGKLGSMSQMVRDALDDYLQKRMVSRSSVGRWKW